MADLVAAHYEPVTGVVTIWLDLERAEHLAESVMEETIREGRSRISDLHWTIEAAIEEAKDRR